MKRIVLIPLDGTAFSRQILPEAMKLFPPEHYRVKLLHVAVPPTGFPGQLALPAMYKDAILLLPTETPNTRHPIYDTEELDTYRRELERQLEADVQPLSSSGYETEMIVLFGRPVDAIVNTIEAEEVDLVMMGTHDRGALARFFVGSVTFEVQKHSSVPMLIVKLDENLITEEARDDILEDLPEPGRAFGDITEQMAQRGDIEAPQTPESEGTREEGFHERNDET